MKNLYESILDDEDVLINQTRDTGIDGFANTISVISKEIEARCVKASKDKSFKEFKFPTLKEIHAQTYELFKRLVLNHNKYIASKLNDYVIPDLKIYYTGKSSAQELNDARPLTKNGFIDDPEEVKILRKEYFNNCDFIKLKSDTGNIQIKINPGGYWYLDGKKIYIKFKVVVNYNPSAATVRATLNKKVLDVFGHEIHEGDWCAGTQLSDSKIIYGPVKMTKARDKLYINDGTYDNICEFYNCIVIKHNGKPVNFSDVKDKAFGNR